MLLQPAQSAHARTREPALPGIAALGVVLCGHAALGAWLLHPVDPLVRPPQAIRMDVRLVEFIAPVQTQAEAIVEPAAEPKIVAVAPEPPKPVVQPEPIPEPTPEPTPELKPELKPEPKPEPTPKPRPEPKPQAQPDVPPKPVPATKVADVPTTIANAGPTNAQPLAAARPEPATNSAPAFVEARFDADYLRNPAPVYPPMSRRRGEQGEVLLLVAVSADGRPERVEIRQSSGFARLDEAALRAVREWRFVPARRGGRSIAANVVVPIEFRLST